MLDDRTREAYARFRREHPLASAYTALRDAKGPEHDLPGWERPEGARYDGQWTKQIGEYDVHICAKIESHGPMPGDGYGEYEDGFENEVGYWTLTDAPLGLPSRHFVAPPANQDNYNRDGSNFFVPDNIEEQYEWMRTAGGMSKGVARDTITEWAEETSRELYTDLTYYLLTVTVYREGVELGGDTIGTSLLDPSDEEVLEHALDLGLVDEAIGNAEDNLRKLDAPVPETGACIERKYLGGTERVTFDHFARLVVQDEEEAAVIARRMLDGADPHPFNEPASGAEAEFYEEFSVIDRAALTTQLNSQEG